LKIENIPQIYI